MLCRCNLIVLCLCGNAHLPQLNVDLLHKGSNSLTDGSEIVIVHLLSFWRHCAKQGTSGVDQVFSLQEFLCIYQEVFLLRSYGRSYFLGSGVSEQF